jgi:hypothetical protein
VDATSVVIPAQAGGGQISFSEFPDPMANLPASARAVGQLRLLRVDQRQHRNAAAGWNLRLGLARVPRPPRRIPTVHARPGAHLGLNGYWYRLPMTRRHVGWLMLAAFLSLVLSGVLVRTWRCPRCRKPFFGRYFGATRCLHCGLPKYAAGP